MFESVKPKIFWFLRLCQLFLFQLKSINIYLQLFLIRENVKYYINFEKCFGFYSANIECISDFIDLSILITFSCSLQSQCFFFLDYCKELRMYVSEFLYEEDNLSLFMLIPDSINPDKSDQKVGKNTSESDLSDLIKRLSENEGIHTLHKILNDDMKKPSELFSFWPIFEMEEDPKISELLLFLGLEEFALSDAIELNNSISGHKHSVHVDKIVHRVHVKVTREDTVAGAMTVFTTGQEVPSSSKIDTNVNCKFPFIWLLYDKLHKSILFIGTFN